MTPCREVVKGATRHYGAGRQRLFPKDVILVELGAESFLGIPMLDASGRVIGHLAVMDDKPMEEPPRGMSVLKFFASRAAAELERLKSQEPLKPGLTEVVTLRNRL